MRLAVCLGVLLGLAGCADRPQLVMLNPQTGMTVGCQVPNPNGGSGEFLVTRACLSACQAHGFHPVPGAQAGRGGDGVPQLCLD